MSFATLLLEPELPAGPDTSGVMVARPDGDETVSYFDLVDAAERMAATLAEAGVAPRTPVACLLPPSADVVAAFFGTWAADGVYVPVNPRLSDTEIAYILDDVSPAAVIGSPDQLDRVTSPITRIAAHGELGWSVAQRRDTEPASHNPGIAIVSFTSGTTGRPKPIELQSSAVIRLMDTIINTVRKGKVLTERPTMPHVIPVSTSLWAGIYNVIFAVRTGSPALLMPKFDALEYARVVSKYQIASTVIPPAAITMLNDEPSIDSLDPLRIVRSITAPLSPLQARRFYERFGVMVLNGYGQTEVGGEVVGWTARDFREHPEKLGAVGRPYRGVDLRFSRSEGDGSGTQTDETSHRIDDGDNEGLEQSGELWVRTAYTASLDPQGRLGDRVDGDGFFRTGDIARLDKDGFLWIEGRVSDMINRGGLKVFPAEVEEVLLLSESVSDAAVVGVPDDRLGEVPHAFVVPADGNITPDTDQLEQICRQHLAPYKVPVAFDTLEALPRSEVGKVLRRVLVEQATA
ncbi:class I adenylate-forming enzyme family protein [Candidatus Poriferisocius sp.]|uniref:class I adenylate-forming enzyme family protein n=1 Tax=Candidatus Poriferisocius sp. TaxID=3101276 RepID=UPI003B51AA02